MAYFIGALVDFRRIVVTLDFPGGCAAVRRVPVSSRREAVGRQDAFPGTGIFDNACLSMGLKCLKKTQLIQRELSISNILLRKDNKAIRFQ